MKKLILVMSGILLISSLAFADVDFMPKNSAEAISFKTVESMFIISDATHSGLGAPVAGLHIKGRDSNNSAVELVVTPQVASAAGIDLVSLAKEISSGKVHFSASTSWVSNSNVAVDFVMTFNAKK